MRMDIDQDYGLTLDEYQSLALDSKVYDQQYSILYPSLNLAGEAGEVAGKIAKRLRDFGGDFEDKAFKEEVAKELGDVLWHVAVLAQELGYPLEAIAEGNLSKLASRMERGVIQGSGDNR